MPYPNNDYRVVFTDIDRTALSEIARLASSFLHSDGTIVRSDFNLFIGYLDNLNPSISDGLGQSEVIKLGA